MVIVIDPGHGGENLGGEYQNFTEKHMTMTVANAMKDHLEQFEDVTVYLTHEDDVDMSLKERADFAQSVQADFLFCLHFNISTQHNLFGTEVWVPSAGEFYSKGYSFAQIQIQEMTDLGLFSRGIKTRLNDRGTDYYGILRECTADDIPSVLIEHCHLDHPNDAFAVENGEESLRELGVRDAQAVAKYFCLHSKMLDVDYSDYPVAEVPVPQQPVRPDDTEPEVNQIELAEVDAISGKATIRMQAVDSDSYIQYYMYSLDGGNTYSDLFEWPRTKSLYESDEQLEFVCDLPFDRKIELRTAAYNAFDKMTESNIITVEAIPDPESQKQEEHIVLQEQEEGHAVLPKQDYKEIDYKDVTAYTVMTVDETTYMSEGVLATILSDIFALMILLFAILIKNLRRLKRRNRSRRASSE